MMKPEYILPLADTFFSRASVALAGGKGLAARLSNAGLPVPDGFHVTTLAYQQFVARTTCSRTSWPPWSSDASDPATLADASRAIYDLFAQRLMPQDIPTPSPTPICSRQSPISNLHTQPTVAVRLSATARPA